MISIKVDAVKAVVDTDAIQNGKWLHLRSPIIADGEDEGDLLYLDPVKKEGPVRVKVRSVRSKYFRQKDLMLQTRATTKATRAKGKEKDAAVVEAVGSERSHRFSYLVTGMENVSREAPGIQTPSEEDLAAIGDMDDLQWMVDQVMRFAFDDSNYPGAGEIAKKQGDGAGEPKASADVRTDAPA